MRKYCLLDYRNYGLVQLASASTSVAFQFSRSRQLRGKDNLMTPATLNDHVLIFLQNDIALIQEIQDGNGRKLSGRAAWLGYLAWAHQVH